MRNEEIDIRLKLFARAIPNHEAALRNKTKGIGSEFRLDQIRNELELLNMNLMPIWEMLGEIAKRLPEEKK